MKEFVIAAILALSISCVFGGYQSTSSPQPVSVRNVIAEEHTQVVAKEGNIQIGELKVVDSDTETRSATEVSEDGTEDSRIRFPQFGRYR